MQRVFSERLLASLRARNVVTEEDHDDPLPEPDDRIDPDDCGPRLSVALKESCETCPSPVAPVAQASGRCPDTGDQSKRTTIDTGAPATVPGTSALPDLLDPAVLRTMPPKVAAFMLHTPREPPPWRYRETGAEREFREQCESDGAWCG
jgi:hypothetical protein